MAATEGQSTPTAHELLERLRRRKEMEHLVLSVSQRFMSVSAEAVDAAIQETLRESAQLAGVEMAQVLAVNRDRGTFSMTHMWRHPDAPPVEVVVSEVPLPLMFPELRLGQLLRIDDTETARDDNRAIANLREHHVRALLSVPLLDGGAVIGSVGLSKLGAPHAWTEEEETLLRFVAETLTQALRRAREERQREELAGRLSQAERLEAVGQLAGGVAHDFNNLLLVILSSVDFALLDLADEDKLRDNLEQIRFAGQRAAELVRQLLTFGRKQAVKKRPLDLNALLSSLYPLLRRVIPEDIEIDLIAGHNVSTVHADPVQLEQAMVNLAINARDAMLNGGRLTIETHNVRLNGEYQRMHPWATPGRYVLVTVTDTGIGISKENLPRVFEPFFTTKENGRGTGLGLASTYGIVRSHDGYIHVYSEPGQGTTFKIYLPAAESTAVAVGPALDSRVLGGNERILLAEDEVVVAEVIRQKLERAGYSVSWVNDGERALTMFLADPQRFDLAILDVVMPSQSGVKVAEDMRRARPGFPVILTSGYTAGHVTTGPREALPMLSKPFEPDELLRTIRRVLGR